jgi:hypothetical protein
MRKLFVPLLAMGLVVFADVSYAAFGARSSSGVSRSYSRPSTPTYSKPATTYKTPSYSSSSQSSSNSYNSGYKSNYNSGYSNNGYRSNSYNEAPRQSSTMRDIGVTAAGVGGGILAASAITALISSPGHAGMYTHPQYPGQYFNQQGQPVAAPVPQRQAAPQEYLPEQGYAQPQQQYQQPQVVVVQQPKEGITFFGALWGMLWFIIKLAFFLSVVGAIAFGVYKLYLMVGKTSVQEKIRKELELNPSTRSQFGELDSKAMDIFYNFQKNSDNAEWIEANTKYLPIDDCLAPPSKVLRYEHKTVDCAVEQGKVRGSVLYHATLNDGTGEVVINQFWNFEKEHGVWLLIGIEQND